MTKTYISLGIAAVLFIVVGVGAYMLYQKNGPAAETQTYTNSEVGFELTYRTAPNGYVLLRPQAGLDPNVQDTAVLMLQDEYEELLEAEAAGLPREGPPSITIMTFPNEENASLAEWVVENRRYTNVQEEEPELEETTVAGQPAVRFMTDGLYPSRNVAVLRGDHVIFLNGQYLEQDSRIYDDFDSIVDSLSFL